MDNSDIRDKIKLFSKNKGLFIVADYKIPNGSIETARGRLTDVNKLTGDIIITHLKDERISWGFNLRNLQNHKFSPVMNGGGE